jgi:hypothetical protein
MHINLLSFSCSIRNSGTCRCHLLVFFMLKFNADIHRLRVRWPAGAEAMQIVNLKLYLENRCIIAENQRLREKASALRRENLALMENLSKTAAGAGAA